MTDATPFRHPRPKPPSVIFREAEAVVMRGKVQSTIDMAIAKAAAALERIRKSGASLQEIQVLEQRLKNLEGQAHDRLRRSLEPQLLFETRASKTNVDTAICALKSETHWASKDYRANLIKIIEGNQRIPEEYKRQLPQDVARVLELCPEAGGLAKELTLRGQHAATGSRSKLGSDSNAAIGAAYEIMGTAALGNKISRPVNSNAPPLFIRAGHDVVTFGDKSYLNGRQNGETWQKSSRRTIECDIRIYRPVGPLHLQAPVEIGVDFKHVKESGRKTSSAELRNQVEHVAQALREGQIDEYHFVTNGTFSTSFRSVIDAANTALVASGNAPIGCHEHVSTTLADPFAAGEALKESH